MNFFTATGAVESVAAVEIITTDARKELHVFMESAWWSMHSSILDPVMVLWATRGVYMGSRRVRLSVQADDFFLSTETWDPNKQADGTKAFRLSPTDVQNALDYLTWLNAVWILLTSQ